MKEADTRKLGKAAPRTDRSTDGRAGREPEHEFGLGSEEERRTRRDRILEEHRETIKRLGE